MKNKTLISDLRKQKGLTQERLSELTGLNVPIGPKFIPAMTEDCNKFLTVSNIIG